MKEKENIKEVKITQEERDLIFKGVRPEGMNYEVFKQARKDLKRALKRYKGGQFKHVSVNLDPKYAGMIEPKGTYTRTTKKKYEGIGRLWEKNKS